MKEDISNVLCLCMTQITTRFTRMSTRNAEA